jgi:alkaline phosphatase
LFTYLPGDERIHGVINSTDMALICAGVWGIDLAATTKSLYNNAAPYFKSKRAVVTVKTGVKPDGSIMTVEKGNTTLIIPENKNYVFLNGVKVPLNSVIVNQDGNFYVPKRVLDFIN